MPLSEEVSRTCRIAMLRKARSKASREKSADVIVAKKSGKPDGAKDRTVNHLEYVLIESFRRNTCREEYHKY